MKLPLERCQVCGGIWFDKEEIEAIAGLVGRSPPVLPDAVGSVSSSLAVN
jgi:Zn-finger nucleic acid-binding protein